MGVGHDDAALGNDLNSTNNRCSGASAAASIPSRQQAQAQTQAQHAVQVRRSSLINVAADDPLVSHYSYSDASDAAASPLHAHKATLSRPKTSPLALQQLLQSTRHRSTSAVTPFTVKFGVSQPEALLSKTRRHTLAGDYQTLLHDSAGGTSSHISHHTTAADNGIGANNTARLCRFSLVPTTGTTLSASNHTPGPVVPVPSEPSRTHSDSTRTRTRIHAIKQATDLSRTLPHLLHTQSEPQVHTVYDPYVPQPPSSPICIPIPRGSKLSEIPLTARPREGLPPRQDQLLETTEQREERSLLLPYYTKNATTPPSPGRASSKSYPSSNSLSSRSSGRDLPTGALSPLSTKSRDGHQRCPSSPSRKRLSRRSARRLAAQSQGHHAKLPGSTQMRTSSTTSGITYRPTSPLSPGSPRSINAVMQQNRNAGARSRKPQPEFQIPLPRFHPAVYVSPSASQASTAANSPRTIRTPHGLQPPMSPRTQRHNDQAKAALLETYNELVRATGAPGALPLSQELPGTPSLVPARSPGEATPLNLEDGPGDYLTAGAVRRGQHVGATSQREMVERMILEEEERRKGNSSVPSSAPVSPAAGN